MSQVTGLLSPLLAEIRLRQIIKHIGGKNINILDIGCSETKIPELLKDKINKYTGIDLLEDVIEINKKKYPKHEFHKKNILGPDFLEGESFDYIIMGAFIEHLSLEDNITLFNKLRKKLKKEGKIIITTPHEKAEKIHEIGAIISLFSKEAAEEHKCFFDKNLLFYLAEESNLKINTYKKFQFGLNQICIYENIR